MSRAKPYASAIQIRSDSADLPAGTTIEHRGVLREVSRVTFALYQGRSSHGYQTDYQRVETYWLECFAYAPDGRAVRRVGWQFTGRDAFNRADSAYRKATGDIAERYPGCSASFPTGTKALAAV